MRGIAFYHLHQIGDQIRPAQQLGIDLAPLFLDGLFLADQPVAHRHQQDGYQDRHNHQHDDIFHVVLLVKMTRMMPNPGWNRKRERFIKKPLRLKRQAC